MLQDLTVTQAFWLGVMVAYTPSVIWLAWHLLIHHD